MRDLLYVPGTNPPEQVLHHAILYRDSIATLVPDESSPMSDQLAQVYDAGLYKPVLARELWRDDSVQVEAWNTLWRGVVNGHRRRGPLLERGRDRMVAFVAADREAANAAFRAVVENPGRRSDYFFASRAAAESKGVDHAIWDELIGEMFSPFWSFTCTAPDEPSDWPEALARNAEFQAKLLAGTAYSLAGQARRDSTSALLVPCYPPEMAEIIDDCAVEASGDHLLVRIDVGQFLPEAPPGVDTGAVIDFRRRFDDERRRLIYAVERLVKEAAKAHGAGEPADIERDVREELDIALTDMRKAGRSRLGGLVRRVSWFSVAAGAGAASGPVGAAAGSVAANWASNALPLGSQAGAHGDYTYLYRVRSALHDFEGRTAAGADTAG